MCPSRRHVKVDRADGTDEWLFWRRVGLNRTFLPPLDLKVSPQSCELAERSATVRLDR
jgi:hypothetical protein